MIVANASSLVKLVVTEDYSNYTRGVFNETVRNKDLILVPEIALGEVLNALWKHLIIKKDINQKDFDIATSNLIAVWGL